MEPSVTLNNGVKMPLRGYGVYQVPDPKECEESVLAALKAGYRMIDTAAIYNNEEAVGRAIKKSGIPRSEIFLITKLWVEDAGYEKAKVAFARSLKKLGTDYVDLYLIHQPFGDYYGAWRAMEEIYAEKKARAIGVSNFYPDRLVDLILHNKVTPAVNQVETHVFFQQKKAREVMKKYNVQIQSWGPFAEGKNNFFRNPILTSIGEKHGKSAAQVALRWLLQSNIVAIPKSVHEERIIQNFDIVDFELTKGEMEEISKLDTGSTLFFNHSDPSFAEFLGSLKRDE